MKRLGVALIGVLLVMLCCVSTGCAASSGKCGANLTWYLDANGVLTISGTGTMNSYNTYETYAPWYSMRSMIKEVIIERGVTSIGNSAFFFGDSTLTRVTISDTVTSIGEHAFRDCFGLTNLTLPNSVTSIGAYAFHNCRGLTGITLSENLTCIPHDSFYYCSSLADLIIPESVTAIDDNAFFGCTTLTNLSIPESVESIGYYAFSGCTGLQSIIFGHTPVNISNDAFERVTACVTYHENKAWKSKCQNYGGNLTWNAIPHTVEIDPGISATCTETGLSDGSHCAVCGDIITARQELPLHSATTQIDSAVEPDCITPGLTQGSHCTACGVVLVAQEVVEALGHTEVADEAVAPTCTATGLKKGKHCAVCETVLVAQCEIPMVSQTWMLRLPASVSRVEEEAFLGNSALYSVALPENCAYIGAGVFAECDGLRFVRIPNGSCAIADTAFGGNRDVVIVTVAGSETAQRAAELGLICALLEE